LAALEAPALRVVRPQDVSFLQVRKLLKKEKLEVAELFRRVGCIGGYRPASEQLRTHV
jgi:hypothetical protein